MVNATPHSVAVTGATGFIGRAVVPALAGAGFSVAALSRGAGGAAAPGVVWHRVDYTDAEYLARALSGVGTVIHLADDPERAAGRGAEAGVAMVRALATAMAAAGAGRLILASSVYARLAPGPGSYGAAKAAVEDAAAEASSGAAHVVLRLPPVYGAGGRGGFMALARLAGRGVPLPFALARAPRDYLWRQNLADLVVAMAGADDAAWDAARRQVFEPSDGRPIATADLVRALARARGRTARLVPVPAAVLRGLGRLAGRAELVAGALDPLETTGNADLERLFGWRPAGGIPESLAFLGRDPA